MTVELNAKINKSVVLKRYNQSNIEQHNSWAVKIRHNDNCVKCSFFVVAVDGLASLGMIDVELLGMIRVICQTIENKTAGKNV